MNLIKTSKQNLRKYNKNVILLQIIMRPTKTKHLVKHYIILADYVIVLCFYMDSISLCNYKKIVFTR